MKTKTILLWTVICLLIASLAMAALWSDYAELGGGDIADNDDFLVRDVSANIQKRYTWASLWTRVQAPASDDTWQGHRMNVTVGENVTQWDLLYARDSSGNLRWYKYDADLATYKYYAPRAIALATVASGGTCSVGIGDGIAKNNGWSQVNNQDEGKDVFASTTAGAITLTAPSTSGNEVARVGYVLEENVIMFSLGNVTLVEVQ